MRYVVDRNVVMRRMAVPERRGTSARVEIASEAGLCFVVFKKTIYVERNFESRLCYHCCIGQAIIILRA